MPALSFRHKLIVEPQTRQCLIDCASTLPLFVENNAPSGAATTADIRQRKKFPLESSQNANASMFLLTVKALCPTMQ